jgi:hypothetical protein
MAAFAPLGQTIFAVWEQAMPPEQIMDRITSRNFFMLIKLIFSGE